MLKAFDQEQWALHDAPAKLAAIDFWCRLGYNCAENPDEFGVDLLVDGKGKTFGCEVEIKTKWHGSAFQFPTLRIAMRKRKFMAGPCQFMVFNSGLTHAAIVSRKMVQQSPLVEVKNVIVPMGERFYDVPTANLTVVSLVANTG